ncbi:hypothetical protein AY601_1782 [Pedobacter cryoconitis]|uniref:Metallo-beta-lactamase domain-containing protein n=1 Tax=Pedobacter cryoconitis TaxID=188932 RepID=A0A127VBL2_9SPHI|nr:MBL fold metallo-hydrolase [Pedobacter cryoconitis]AMP98694.1 hypothetical protein AY601_1782 [Pedobacter cryoconitis]
MEVHFYRCGCADAARISFLDERHKPCHVFIDAGVERSFRQVLSDEISAIASRGERISLWIISHIHDDHIGGAIGYVNAIKANLLPDIVEKWWYNSPRLLPKVSDSINKLVGYPSSIRQGDQLTEYLNAHTTWGPTPVVSGSQLFEISGLKIKVLSPGAESLRRLQEKYKHTSVPLEWNEEQQTSEATASPMRDYHLTVAELLQVSTKEDNNIENGSSIGILTDYPNCKILWLADSHPDVVSESLISLGYSEKNPLVCDWVKISHHGSAANNSPALYRMIRCSNYVISVTGENAHGLPNKAALVNILKARQQPKIQQYNFYFTHDDSVLRSIFSVDGDKIFDDLNFKTFYLGNEKSFKIIISEA